MTNEIQTLNNGLAESLCDPNKVNVIKNMFAKGCSNDEFAVFIELARRYQLDPFAKQIWAVKYGNDAAQIFVGRDGLLSIAHRTGNFDGMESGVTVDESGETVGWAKVYRKDMSHPFYITVPLSEYTTKKSLWLSKPRTMIQKVAEAQCLRRAFSISGLYTKEEMPEYEDCEPPAHVPQEPPTRTCRCGKPAMTGMLLDKYQRSFKENRGINLPIFICQECADKLWEETAPQKLPDEKEVIKEAQAEVAASMQHQDKTPVCKKCGQPAMTGELLEKYAGQFRDVFGHKLETPICEECARALWNQLMQTKEGH